MVATCGLCEPTRTPTKTKTRCMQVGFRNVKISCRQLLINGQPVMIKGVNRHEHDERRGKAITEVITAGSLASSYSLAQDMQGDAHGAMHAVGVYAVQDPCSVPSALIKVIASDSAFVVVQASMLADIRLMKQLNFNAVRASHYPNHTRWCALGSLVAWRYAEPATSCAAALWSLCQAKGLAHHLHNMSSSSIHWESSLLITPLRVCPDAESAATLGSAGMSSALSTAST